MVYVCLVCTAISPGCSGVIAATLPVVAVYLFVLQGLQCCRRLLSVLCRAMVCVTFFAESGDSDEEGGSDGGRGAAAARREPVPALDDTGDGCWGPSAQPDGAGVGVGLQDEIERVLGHRWVLVGGCCGQGGLLQRALSNLHVSCCTWCA